jgi:hypothetical protein
MHRCGQALVLDPEQIEAQLVAFEQLVVVVAAPEALGAGLRRPVSA